MEGILVILVPILVPIAAFVALVLIEKQKAEIKRKMIDAGMNPYEKKKSFSGAGALKWGYLLVGLGIALFLANVLDTLYDFKGDSDSIYFGLIGIFGGIGLILAHKQARKEDRQDKIDNI